MRVELDVHVGIFIRPETDFEASYIEQAFDAGSPGRELKCFVKRGLSLADVAGIKICLPEDKKVIEPRD